MKGIEGIEKKEALPEITIERYAAADRESLVAGVADIQEVERNLSDTRRAGGEMGEEYFSLVEKEVAEKSGAIFVAKAGNRVAGFIVCWIECDDDLGQTKESNTYLYISDAWVAPDLRDRGLFATLNEQVETYVKQFPEIHFIRMSVIAGNNRALAAYERMGYAPEEIRMTKRIAPTNSEDQIS